MSEHICIKCHHRWWGETPDWNICESCTIAGYQLMEKRIARLNLSPMQILDSIPPRSRSKP